MSSTPEGPLGTVLVLNGPNLNLLGTREPGIYGTVTLADIEQLCDRTGEHLGLGVRCVQSNHEGSLVDAIHEARGTAAGIIINPAAYSHTSVAIRDALAGVELPVVEVHISNIHQREEFRHHSFVSAVADVVIAGAGPQGYAMALDWMGRRLSPAAAAD